MKNSQIKAVIRRLRKKFPETEGFVLERTRNGFNIRDRTMLSVAIVVWGRNVLRIGSRIPRGGVFVKLPYQTYKNFAAKTAAVLRGRYDLYERRKERMI